MPVSIVAGQARSLQGEHSPSYTLTDRCQQTTESGPFVRSTARSSQVVINDNDFGKAQLFRSICQSRIAALCLPHGGELGTAWIAAHRHKLHVPDDGR